ncbi:MAG TPA: helix-turn-helix transcriptional regulator [Pseudomonadota bacterium]|nr:helix-turn-helix transcriptional regulator [Pseudomonadota bacterium]
MPEPKSTLKIHFVGEQVAAARKLLKMSQIELAAATGLTTRTLIKFEGGGNVRPETVEAIREVLVSRGIVFTNGGEPGVKLRQRDLED